MIIRRHILCRYLEINEKEKTLQNQYTLVLNIVSLANLTKINIYS